MEAGRHPPVRTGKHERGQSQSPAVSAPRGTVLVIDDDRALLELFVMALRDDEGFPVRTAYSVACALAAWEPECEPPALILLDATLPGEEIHAAAARLRSRPGWERVRLVLCSGREDVAALARSLGAADYVRKPFDIDHLIAVAERHACAPAGDGMV